MLDEEHAGGVRFCREAEFGELSRERKHQTRDLSGRSRGSGEGHVGDERALPGEGRAVVFAGGVRANLLPIYFFAREPSSTEVPPILHDADGSRVPCR